MKKLSLYLLIVLILLSCTLFDPPNTEEIEVNFIEKVLDGYFVESIAFENDGTAWVGTFGPYGQGLIRYNTDGSMDIFNNSNSIIDDSTTIWDIEVDVNGYVWFGNDGLICYNGNEFIQYELEHENLYPNRIMSIASDNNGTIWLSSWSHGDGVGYKGCVASFLNDDLTVYTPLNSNLPSPICYDIEIDGQNNIWTAHPTSISKYNGTFWTNYNSEQLGFEPFSISDIDIDSRNIIYGVIDYAGFSGGMMYPSLDKPTIFSFDGLQGHTILTDSVYFRTMLIDQDDHIWCSSTFNMRCYDNTNLIEKARLNSNHNSFVIKESPSGDIWIGGGDGVYIYQK